MSDMTGRKQTTSGARRFLFLTSCPLPWGGSEELWSGAALRLRQRGHTILTGRSEFWEPGPLPARWAALQAAGVGVKNFRMPLLARAIPELLYRRLPAAAPFAFGIRNRYLSFRLRGLRPDLVVISQGGTFDGMASVELPLLARAAGIPYVLISQKNSEMDWPMDPVRAWSRDHFRLARRVYFVSRHNRRITEEQLGMDVQNGEVVRNPFMLSRAEPLPWPESPGGVLKLACVGRLWPREKGQDLLLNVLARPEWRERPVEVDFFGEGPVGEGLEGMARWLGLEGVRFRGFVGDITEVWRDHHALVLPSRSEGLPLAQVEAMICGRVVIMTPAGGTGEIVEDGVTGFLARAATVDDLAAAMERAWAGRERWPEIGARAGREIWRHFPADPCGVLADKLEALLAEGSRG